METLIGAILVCLLWLTLPKRRKNGWVKILATVLIGIILIFSPMSINLLTKGLMVAVPPDSGDRVDTIVVLGRGESQRETRLVEVFQLWNDERASNIFASGMMDAKPMVRYLREAGVPHSVLGGEECSQSTEENGAFATAILRPKGINDILLVTDDAHMWRSLLVFRSFGFQVIPHPVKVESPERTTLQQLSTVIREYVGLINYALTGKFRERSQVELESPHPEIIQKLNQWNCEDKVLKF